MDSSAGLAPPPSPPLAPLSFAAEDSGFTAYGIGFSAQELSKLVLFGRSDVCSASFSSSCLHVHRSFIPERNIYRSSTEDIDRFP